MLGCTASEIGPYLRLEISIPRCRMWLEETYRRHCLQKSPACTVAFGNVQCSHAKKAFRAWTPYRRRYLPSTVTRLPGLHERAQKASQTNQEKTATISRRGTPRSARARGVVVLQRMASVPCLLSARCTLLRTRRCGSSLTHARSSKKPAACVTISDLILLGVVLAGRSVASRVVPPELQPFSSSCPSRYAV